MIARPAFLAIAAAAVFALGAFAAPPPAKSPASAPASTQANSPPPVTAPPAQRPPPPAATPVALEADPPVPRPPAAEAVGPADPGPSGFFTTAGILALLALALSGAALAGCGWMLSRRGDDTAARQRTEALESAVIKLADQIRALRVEVRNEHERLDRNCDGLSSRIMAMEQVTRPVGGWAERASTAAKSPVAESGRSGLGYPGRGSDMKSTLAEYGIASAPTRPSIGSSPPPAYAPAPPVVAPSVAAAMPPPRPPAAVPERALLKAVQDAVDAVLGDGAAANAEGLTRAVTAHLQAPLAQALRAARARVCSHNSSAGLAADFYNPDFFSLQWHDGRAYLLPNPRASYAHSFVRYYEGNGANWPDFEAPATCSLDASDRATLLQKGRL
jgi:hypothetical protein